MDFDHLDPSSKLANISQMVIKNREIAEILAEAKKCEVVCANCHRERTHRRYAAAFEKRKADHVARKRSRASKVIPEHGTKSRYYAHKCRCDKCRSVAREYERNRRERIRREVSSNPVGPSAVTRVIEVQILVPPSMP